MKKKKKKNSKSSMVEIKNTQIIKKRKRNVSSGSRPDFLFWCEKY